MILKEYESTSYRSRKEGKIFINIGVNVNEIDKSGRSALHAAACVGHCKIANLLLDNGANINETDYFGMDVHSSGHCTVCALDFYSETAVAARQIYPKSIALL